MLTIFTNSSSMSSTKAMSKATGSMNIAMQRLGTGKRINAAADDAAGLQISTRLQAQSNGMSVAKQNIAKSTAMLQTAEGAFEEITQILYRVQELMTQAADDTHSAADRHSIREESISLIEESQNIMNNTAYGSEKLFGSNRVMGKTLQFQIGAGSDETMQVNFSADIKDVFNKMGGIIIDIFGNNVDTASGANGVISKVADALDSVGKMRAKLGANINRLGHTAANLANMQDNTNLNIGAIRDADFASEATSMTRNQMLMQSSQAMLKQSSGMSGMLMKLLG